MPDSPVLRRALRPVLAGLTAASLTMAVIAAMPSVAEAAPSCGAFTSKVYDQLNPTTQSQALSASAASYATFQARGFTTNRADSVTASPKAGSSLAAVHRLYRASTKHFFYTRDTAEIARAVKNSGYQDQGTVFYAATSSASCLVPVWSYWHPRGIHRFTTSATEGAQLVKAGWRKELVRFYLGKPASTTFTIGVMPDTQREVWSNGDTRFAHRTNWLVANKNALSMRFVAHTGDIVDWDTASHDQYVRARAALARLNGQIPYAVSIGNHDTAAVGVGGSAADDANTDKLVRDTRTANAYLNQGTAALAGRFESGKVDNTYYTFSAGGLEWMVLSLELWPRKEVVAWANKIVKAHPKHNVLVATHSFMMGNGTIYQRSDYGATSPQYLYDNLLKVNPNIKMIFSGHTGSPGVQGAGGGQRRQDPELPAHHARRGDQPDPGRRDQHGGRHGRELRVRPVHQEDLSVLRGQGARGRLRSLIPTERRLT